jgi:uncharacterized protein (TIGR02598 family)
MDGGFSLTEVAMAMGMIAFAFVALLGLLPVGLQTMRDAIDTTVTAQIASRLVNDAQQTDFDTLTNPEDLPEPSSRAFRQRFEGDEEFRYFDDQGVEVPAEDKAKAIYHAIARISPVTEVPTKDGEGIERNDDLATITVQVAFNPNNRSIEFYSESANQNSHRELIKPQPGLKVATYSFAVARNETRNPKP